MTTAMWILAYVLLLTTALAATVYFLSVHRHDRPRTKFYIRAASVLSAIIACCATLLLATIHKFYLDWPGVAAGIIFSLALWTILAGLIRRYLFLRNRLGDLIGHARCSSCDNTYFMCGNKFISLEENLLLEICDSCFRNPGQIDPDVVFRKLTQDNVDSQAASEIAFLVWRLKIELISLRN